MSDAVCEELLRLNQRLLDCIASADWPTYLDLCSPSLTAFEPEGMGQLIDGLEFHHFYFNLGGVKGSNRTTMCSPRVRIMGDVAVVTYVRLNQRLASDRSPVSTCNEETRIWQRQDGRWKHVHFHRSAAR
jgi:hypothetical protein